MWIHLTAGKEGKRGKGGKSGTSTLGESQQPTLIEVMGLETEGFLMASSSQR